MKIFNNKEDFIEGRIKDLKENLTKNLDKLPKEELPFMEPHLRALYFETYFLIAEGFYNSSLVLMGILLESFAKEKLFNEGVKDEELEEMDFGKVLSKIKLFISNEEFNFLKDKKTRLRNPYAHNNRMKLSQGVDFITWEISNPVEKLISLDKKVKNGELTEAQARQELIKNISPKLMTSKEFRPLAQIAKSEIDKEQAIPIFLEVDKFIRDFAIKYFNPKI